ncbi:MULTISPECIES: YiiG family protein [Rhizobium]|uniref:YiiG family protein n=1 Tax=Rhizobium TaxID=379 RepID=UPI0028B107DF
MRIFTSRAFAVAAVSLLLQVPTMAPVLSGTPAFAQSSTASEVEVDLSDAAIVKMNAYVEFLNRSIRASESLERYGSWVDMKKGPTGKERVIYGLYSLYDVRDEIAAVEQAAKAEPKMSELDAAMLAYVEIYQKLAPVIEKANKYYERLDYKSDKMEGAKAYHKDIAALAPTYGERRDAADLTLRAEKVKLDLASLKALEQMEGRKSRWHVRNVMIRAEAMMDLMPDNEKPVVDMAVFKGELDAYASAVREFDDYAIDHPDSFHVFESRPASLLSKLRDLDELLGKVKGDARKAGGNDIEWIVSDYNTMVTTSQTATTFAKD